MKIPDCLSLDTDQINALNEWEAQFNLPSPWDECCCGSGHIFHVMPSGIGDSIWIEIKGRRFNVGYDDDGKIIGESFRTN